MKSRSQLILRNATFQGPAGSMGATGAAGPAGPTGPPGVSVLSLLTASAQLTNFVAATDFSLSYNLPANALIVGRVLRVRSIIRWSAGAAISLNPFIDFNGSQSGILSFATTGADSGSADLETLIICTATGAAGSIEMSLRAVQAGSAKVLTFAESFGPTAIDTTVAHTIKHGMVASAGNNTATEDVQMVEQVQ